MDRKKAGILLHKYYQGETTLEEERALRDFFASCGEGLPPELAAGREFFDLLATGRDGGISDEELGFMLDNVTASRVTGLNAYSRRHRLYQFVAVAASLALLFSIFMGYLHFRHNNQEAAFSDTYRDDPALAYAETKRVLLYVSQQMNRGTSELEGLNVLAEPVEKLKPLGTFGEGLDKLQALTKVDKALEKEDSTDGDER